MARHILKGKLEPAGNSLHWTIVRIPEKITKSLGTRGQAKVKGTINGFPFRTALIPDGHGHHILIVNKTMQKGACVTSGAIANLVFEPDKENRPVQDSPELLKALRQDKTVMRYYQSLSDSLRRDISRWVSEAKQAETRVRRAEEMAERLMQIMDGEREPPPILKVAFMRDTRARDAWDHLPKSHRRAHLIGIFHCKTPESQARRIEKAVAMMLEYAEKKRSR